MARTVAEKREILAKLRSHMANGDTEIEQLEILEEDYKVTLKELRGLRAEIIQGEIELSSVSPAEVYVNFRLRMEAVVGDLDEVVTMARAQRSAIALNAAVGACKAKAQILKDILSQGQALGVVHKAPKTTVTIAGVVVTDATTSELARLVATRTAHLELIAASSGGGSDYLSEMPMLEDMYYDPSEVVDITPKKKKRKKKSLGKPERKKVIA